MKRFQQPTRRMEPKGVPDKTMPKSPAPKPAGKGTPKTADDDLVPELSPEEINPPNDDLSTTGRRRNHRRAEDDLVPELDPAKIDTPDEPITPENAIEARRQLQRLRAQAATLATDTRRTFEEMFEEIPQEEEIDAVESLSRLITIAKEHGISDGMIAYADPNGDLKALGVGLESFGPGETWALEGFIDTAKKVMQRIGDALTGRMAPIGEANFARLQSIIDRSQGNLTAGQTWMERQVLRTGFNDDALRYHFPVEYYGQMMTAAGINSALDLLGDTTVAIHNLAETAPADGMTRDTYSLQLNNALPSRFRQYWDVAVVSGGLYFDGGEPPAFAGAYATRRDPMMFELGWQHPQVMIKAMERCKEAFTGLEGVLPKAKAAIASLNEKRAELAAIPEREADARNLQYCIALLFHCFAQIVRLVVTTVQRIFDQIYLVTDAVFC